METTAIIAGLSGLIVFLIWMLRQFVSAIADATGVITSQSATIVRYNDELQENSAQRAAATQELSTATRKFAALSDEFSAFRADCVRRDTEHNALVDRLEKSAIAMREEIRQLTEKLDAAQARIAELEQREKQYAAALKSAQSEITKLKEAGELKNKRLEQLQQRVSDLERQLAESQREQARLKRERDELQKQLSEIKKNDMEKMNNDRTA
jgi:chromosome segregation ATPase